MNKQLVGNDGVRASPQLREVDPAMLHTCLLVVDHLIFFSLLFLFLFHSFLVVL